MSANLNKAMFTKLINGSLVQCPSTCEASHGEPLKNLVNQGFFHFHKESEVKQGSLDKQIKTPKNEEIVAKTA